MATKYEKLEQAHAELQRVKNELEVRRLRKSLQRRSDEKSDFGYNFHSDYYTPEERFNLEEKIAWRMLTAAVEAYNEAWEVVEDSIRPIVEKASVKYYEQRKNSEEIALQTFKRTLTEAGIPYDMKPMEIDDLISD